MQVFLTYTRDKLGCIPRQLPHTGGDAVHDMKLHGPTTQDKCLLFCPNTLGIRLDTHQTSNPLIARPLSEKS